VRILLVSVSVFLAENQVISEGKVQGARGMVEGMRNDEWWVGSLGIRDAHPRTAAFWWARSDISCQPRLRKTRSWLDAERSSDFTQSFDVMGEEETKGVVSHSHRARRERPCLCLKTLMALRESIFFGNAVTDNW